MKIGRRAYVEMFGPTTGDRVRLADTELVIEVEKDFTVYGEEVKFGGGKVIRDGMGQSQRMSKDCADTVITNALVIDWWGIVKCDIAIKAGRIAGLGKAGNPDIQPGVDIVIGAGTEIIAGEGSIVTAGGDRRGIESWRLDGCPGVDPYRHPQRVRLRRDDLERDRRPHHTHLSHRGRRWRSRAGHHQGGRSEERVAVLHQSDTALYH